MSDYLGADPVFQDTVLEIVKDAGTYGITSLEMEEENGWRHGSPSGALSKLHEYGKVTRLKEFRLKYSAYVTPENVKGRTTIPFQGKGGSKAPPPSASFLGVDIQGAKRLEVGPEVGS